MSIRQITWLRAKKIKDTLNGLIQDIYVKLSIKIKTMDDQTLLNVVHAKKWADSWFWVMQIKLIFLIYSLMLMDITSDLTVGLSLKFFFLRF